LTVSGSNGLLIMKCSEGVAVKHLSLKQNGYHIYEGWNFNSGNYLFTTDTK